MEYPGGMSTIRYTRICIYAGFWGQFFFKFSQKKIVMEKKLLCCVNDHLFVEKYTLKFSQLSKSMRKYSVSAGPWASHNTP